METALRIFKTAFIAIMVFMPIQETGAQMLSVKNNLLYDVTMTPNLGFELVVGEHTTIAANLMGNSKPLGKDVKMLAFQPEYRYYFSGRPMFKHFVGLGAIAGSYDITWKGKIYDGISCGAGLVFGYVHKLNKRLNLDFHAGFGAVAYKQKEYFEGDNYDGDFSVNGEVKSNASGYTLIPTDIGISLTYILK
ncbi:MAG: DUF3575 domain-containing protein [Prevotella sp.]